MMMDPGDVTMMAQGVMLTKAPGVVTDPAGKRAGLAVGMMMARRGEALVMRMTAVAAGGRPLAVRSQRGTSLASSLTDSVAAVVIVTGTGAGDRPRGGSRMREGPTVRAPGGAVAEERVTSPGVRTDVTTGAVRPTVAATTVPVVAAASTG